jgi:hypothetical protein
MPILALLSIAWFVLAFSYNGNKLYIFVALLVAALISWWWLFNKLPRNLGLYCGSCKCLLSMGRNQDFAYDYGTCPKCGEKLWNPDN